MSLKALDLFAGSGWGVACKALGITEYGVDNMDAVRETRTANGLSTVYSDVMDGLLGIEPVPEHDLLIASPPCQTFSRAGSGAGSKSLNEVLSAIHSLAYTDPEALVRFGEAHDYRTSLVLAPLAYAHAYRPRLIAWEQVPTVLPVWERCAEELTGMGYSVAVGLLAAETFGVPQTRKRAVLVARLDGMQARLPQPTHSRYYRRDPSLLDPNVLPWISMAEAVGFGFTERPAPTYCNSGNGGAGIEWGGNPIRKRMRKQSAEHDRWKNKDNAEPGTNDAIRVSVREAAVIQTYPPEFTFGGTKTKQYIQVGNAVPPVMAQAILSALTERRP